MSEDKDGQAQSELVHQERPLSVQQSADEETAQTTQEIEFAASISQSVSQAPLPHPAIYGEFERQVPGTAEWLRETAAEQLRAEIPNRHELQMTDLQQEHRGQRLAVRVNGFTQIFLFSAYVALGYFGTTWYAVVLGVVHLVFSNGGTILKRLAELRFSDD